MSNLNQEVSIICITSPSLSPSVCTVTLRASWKSLLTSPRRIRSRSSTTCWGPTCCGGWRPTSSRTCPPRPSWLSEWSWALCRSTTRGRVLTFNIYPVASSLAYIFWHTVRIHSDTMTVNDNIWVCIRFFYSHLNVVVLNIYKCRCPKHL